MFFRSAYIREEILLQTSYQKKINNNLTKKMHFLAKDMIKVYKLWYLYCILLNIFSY